MTKEELTICKVYLDDLDKTHDCNEYKLLMKLLQQEPCEDAISREEITSKIEEWANGFEDSNGYFDGDAVADAIRACIGIVDELPLVTPVRKKGKWIAEDSGNYNGKYSTCYCSNCKDYYTRNWKEMKYCPNCGIEMEVKR